MRNKVLRKKKGEEWTYSDLKWVEEAWKRREKGEKAADLAAEIDVSPEWLYELWRRRGKDPAALAEKQRKLAIEKRCRLVHSMREKGMSYVDIAEQFGLSSSEHVLRVQHRKYCNRLNIKIPKVKSKIEERNKKVHKMRSRDLLTYGECCTELGMEPSKTNITKISAAYHNWCKRKGKKLPNQKKIRKARAERKRKAEDDRYRKAWKERCKGASTKEVANKLGVTTQTLLKRWRDLGFSAAEVHFKEVSTEERNQRVHKLRSQGHTYRECCLELGMEPNSKNAGMIKSTYRAWCRKKGIKAKFGENVLSKEKENTYRQIVQLRKKQIPYKEICRELGLDRSEAKTLPSRLAHFCRTRGIAWPPQKKRDI